MVFLEPVRYSLAPKMAAQVLLPESVAAPELQLVPVAELVMLMALVAVQVLPMVALVARERPKSLDWAARMQLAHGQQRLARPEP